MSAENSPDWIIDLLYADDETDIDSEGLPDEGDLDERDALELEGLRDLLGQVRASHVDVAPPMGLSASIMEAAREASAEASAEAARPERRGAPPRVSAAPSEGSLWGRARANTYAQIGAVAAILLVGTFMVTRIQGDSPMESMTAGALAEVDVDDLEREHAAPAATAADAPGEEAVALNLDPSAAEESPQEQLEGFAGDLERQAEELAPLDELSVTESFDEALDRSRREEGLLAKGAPDQDQAPAPVASTKSAPREELAAKEMIEFDKNSLDGLMDDSLGEAAPAPVAALDYPSKSTRGSSSAPSTSSGFGPEARYDLPNSSGPPSAPSQEPAANKDAAVVGEVAERASQQRNAARTDAARDADDLAAAGSSTAEVESEESKAAAKTAQPSVGEIERMANSERYDDTVAEADRYLSSGLGTNKDRARALELKAEALAAQGKGNEAQRVYDQIEREYPDFYKREEVKRVKRKARKKSPAKSRSFDDSVESVESY